MSHSPDSKLPDVVARMAVDPDFAQHARTEPDAVAEEYGLTDDEKAQMLALTDAAADSGPTELDPRLSKSGFGAGLSGILGDTARKPDSGEDPHASRWVGPGNQPS